MDIDWREMLREWHGPEYARILIIIVSAWLVYQAVKHLVRLVGGLFRPHERFHTLPWIPLLRLGIVICALTLIMPVVIDPTRENMLALFGATAFALGFAIKDYIGDLIAGIIFIVERPYRVGDWIEIGGHYGEVTHLGLRAVLLRTADANDITIPHSTLWREPLSNATSGQYDLLCIAAFYAHPDHDSAAARQTLRDVAATSAYLKLDRPIVVVVSQEPFGLHYKLKAYAMNARDQFLFITDLTGRGQDALRSLGVRPVAAPVSVAG